MPQVTSAMWHWWFGWHGDDSRKYKLWHPQAHISAQWQDKIVGRQEYVDRVSWIEEYIRMIYQVRTTPTGSEMRSRFWLGGKHITPRGGNLFGMLVAPIMRRRRKIPEQFARDLLTHCAEEMSHLAAFLPKLYSEQRP